MIGGLQGEEWKFTIVAVKSMSCHTAKECGHLIPSRYEKRNIY